MRLLLSLAFIAISTPTLATSAVITGASLEGNALTIIGSNFEPENPMLFWDDATLNMNELGLKSGDPLPKPSTGKWALNSQMQFITADDSKSKKQDTYYTGTGRNRFLQAPKHASHATLKHKIFVSWWYRPSISPSAEGGSNKFIRIWDQTNGYGTRISWTHMHFTCNADVKWGSWTGNINQWNHHMINVDLTTNNVKTWVNGKLVIDSACHKTSAYPDNLLYVALVGFDHGSSAYASMQTSVDDIYIATSPARVELSESETWSESMKREVLAITDWNSTKILAKTHKSTIFASSLTYAYVYDKDGVSNKVGFKIKCDKCPKSPFGQ